MKRIQAVLLAALVVTSLLGTPVVAGGGQSTQAGSVGQLTADKPSNGAAVHAPLQATTETTCDFPLNKTDATGTTVTLTESPSRITTTNPSAAQTLWEIGAQDRVVGVTQFAMYLNGTESKTNVSAGFGVSVEKVVATNPDLVLAPNASAGQVEDLREAGLTVYHFPEATTISDIAKKTKTIGQLVGNCQAASSTNEEMNSAVDNVTNRTADFDRPDTLYPLGDGYVAGDETFINEIMSIGGTNNIAAAEGDGYPQLSAEVVIETDPELLLVTDPEAPLLDEEPYASTTAGQEMNYVVMNENYLNQPAPRSVIESVETLSREIESQQPAGSNDSTDTETCGFPVSMTDATGTTITLKERPDRITTTNPSAAQTLWEIGAHDRVVGITRYATYLNGTNDKTDVSAEFGVNVEEVVGTEPDLVLAPNASAGDVASLRRQNLTVYHFPKATSVADIAAKTTRTGRLVGNCDEANRTNEEMNATVDRVKNQTANLNRPNALYPLGGGYVAADDTFINEIMQVGGTNNVAAKNHAGYPQLSAEVILESDPELLLVTTPDASVLDESPYASTTAGINDRYVVMNVSYLNQPAPRSVIESTETLATAVIEDKNILSRESSPAENNQSLVDLSEGAGKVQSVGLTFRPNSTASRVTVSESTSPTGNSSTPSNTVATYLDIEADTDVSKEVELNVTVSKSALGDIAVEDAVLLHYTDGSWKELADSESSRNNNEVTITATTSGLSPFAVAASNAATDNTESSDTGSENDGDDGTTSGGSSIADTDEDAGGSVADDDSSTSTGEGESDDNSTNNETDNSSTSHGDTADDDTTTGDNTNNSTASDANATTNDSTTISDNITDDTTNDSNTISDGTNDDTTSDSTPGFGTLAALTVLVAGTLLAARGID